MGAPRHTHKAGEDEHDHAVRHHAVTANLWLSPHSPGSAMMLCRHDLSVRGRQDAVFTSFLNLFFFFFFSKFSFKRWVTKLFCLVVKT